MNRLEIIIPIFNDEEVAYNCISKLIPTIRIEPGIKLVLHISKLRDSWVKLFMDIEKREQGLVSVVTYEDRLWGDVLLHKAWLKRGVAEHYMILPPFIIPETNNPFGDALRVLGAYKSNLKTKFSMLCISVTDAPIDYPIEMKLTKITTDDGVYEFYRNQLNGQLNEKVFIVSDDISPIVDNFTKYPYSAVVFANGAPTDMYMGKLFARARIA